MVLLKTNTHTFKLIDKVKLDCDGAMGFIFCYEDPSLMRMASCERSRALRPACFWESEDSSCVLSRECFVKGVKKVRSALHHRLSNHLKRK